MYDINYSILYLNILFQLAYYRTLILTYLYSSILKLFPLLSNPHLSYSCPVPLSLQNSIILG